MSGTELTIDVSKTIGRVSGLLLLPPRARVLYVLAHGAGAGMRHPFLEVLATRLAERAIATLRYQFPYMERRAKRPDTPAVAVAAGLVGVFVGLGVGAWFWGTDSRDPSSGDAPPGDPFRPR